ncbi:hypothetical protein GF352_02195 [archaeon]|nr:hypothetical protein [archaeon]
MRLKAGILITLLLLTPGLASMFKASDNVDISSSETINQNAYLAGNLVNINGVVNGDAVTAGNIIVVNGVVNGDLMAAGNSITVNGNVSGDVRATGAMVLVNGEVGGEVLSGTAQLMLSEESTVGEVNAGAASITISGEVLGNVTISADNITITDTAVIGGLLNYTSSNKAVIADENSITGLVQRNEPENRGSWEWTGMSRWLPAAYFSIFFIIISIASKLLFGFVLTRVSKKNIEELKKRMSKEFLNQSITGFAVMILVPIAAIIGLITVIAIPLSLVVLGLYVITLYIASVTAAFFIGSKTLDLLKVEKQSLLIELLIGVIVIELINWVPVIGWLFNFVIWLLSLGALTNLMRKRFNECRKKKIC